MIKIWKWKFGVFFSKTGDYETYYRQIGFRIVWVDRNLFRDFYIYPKPHVHTCRW